MQHGWVAEKRQRLNGFVTFDMAYTIFFDLLNTTNIVNLPLNYIMLVSCHINNCYLFYLLFFLKKKRIKTFVLCVLDDN